MEIEVEGGVNLKELGDHVHVILTCTSIRPSTEIGRKRTFEFRIYRRTILLVNLYLNFYIFSAELVPMVVIQDDREILLALIADHELVALPRQVFPVEEVTSAFMAKKNFITTDVNIF